MIGYPPISALPSAAPYGRTGLQGLVHGRLFFWLLLIVSLGGMVFSSTQAQAAGSGFDYISVNQSFSCPSSTASGNPVNPHMINETIDPDNAGIDEPFKHVLLAWEAALFDSLALGYCAVRELVEPPLLAAGVLAVLIYGASVLFGLTSLSARESMILIIKISLVLMLALNAEIAMKLIYGFFLSVSQDTISWFYSAADNPFSGQDGQFKKFAALFSTNPIIDPQDNLPSDAPTCAGTAIIFLFFIFLVFPIVGGPVFAMMLTLIFMLIRAALGFMVALGAVALLMAASPMFIGFAMFRNTRSFFDRWLQAIISYTLQMIIVFAVIMITYHLFDFWDMFKGLLQAMRISPSEITDLRSFGISFGKSGEVVEFCTPCIGGKFNFVPGMAPFHGFECPPNAKGTTYLASLKHFEFFKYILYNGLSVLLVIWGVNEILEQLPSIAQTLGGSGYAMNLGGGGANSDARGGFGFGNFDKVARNFSAGFRYGYDPGYQQSIKDSIRQYDPDYLKNDSIVRAIPNRFAMAFQQGAEFSKSDMSPDEIFSTLPDMYARRDEYNKAMLELKSAENKEGVWYQQAIRLQEQEKLSEADEETLKKLREEHKEFWKKKEELEQEIAERNYEYNMARERMEGNSDEI